MSVGFVGSVVSLDCGSVLGTYQGRVTRVDQDTQSITVEKAFRNGTRCTVPNITINAADILDLSILKSKDESFPDGLQGRGGMSKKPPVPNLTTSASEPMLSKSNKNKPRKTPDSATSSVHNGYVSSNGSSLGNTNCNASVMKHSDPKFALSTETEDGLSSGNGNPQSKNPASAANFKSPAKNYQQHTGGQNGYANNSGNTGGGYPHSVNTSGAAGHGRNNYQRQHVENGGQNYGNNSYHRGSPANQRASPPRVEEPGMTREGNSRVRCNSASNCYPVSANTKRGYITPKKNEQRRKNPREDCFAAPVDTILDEGEFDFEKNLALFNKQAVFEEIENQGYPKINRPADKTESKYRNDENVLASNPAVFSQIKVPEASKQTQTEFCTDSGLLVPAISYETRGRLFGAAERCGYSKERQIETVGRSASEMVLQLLGGSNRLNPQNAHQRPSVVILCGPHTQGALGINCARHLSAHNVRVTVFLPRTSTTLKELQQEVWLYDMCAGVRTSNTQDLPSQPVDIIINALDDHGDLNLPTQDWYKTLVAWTNQNKAPVLGIDPPVGGGAIDMKWSLSICLPLPLADSCGQIYLCDLSLPSKVHKEVGIKYVSPFAHKFWIPLHRS